jgi:hypothetical protein
MKDPKSGEIHWIVGNLGQNITGAIVGFVSNIIC